MNGKTLTNVLIVCALLSLAGSAVAQSITPTQFVRTKADELILIINRDVSSGPEAVAQRQDDLKASVRHFIDYRLLCQRALGDHWNARTAEEQDAFVELMTQLIETNYTVKLGGSQVAEGYEVEYEDELTRGDNAMVTGFVTYNGEVTQVEILLTRRDDSWIVFDVVTDDVSLQETYAESFDQIITDEGWDVLVQRLRDRLAELETELAEQRSGSH